MSAWARAASGWLDGLLGPPVADLLERAPEPEPFDWVADELEMMWVAAEAEAGLALWDWCETSDHEAYSIYRAAQDRADAAQDALAAWHSGEPAFGPAAGGTA
jgi:hypothetical protein